MITINNRYKISRRLAKLSTIFQDATDSTKIDIPDSIDLPNIGSNFDNDILEMLDSILDTLDKSWSKDPNELSESSSKIETILHTNTQPTIQIMMDITVRLDIRPVISYIMWKSTTIFELYHLNQNVVKACIENCNGYAYNILSRFFDSDYRKSQQLAIYMIDDFIKAEKLTNKIFYEISHDDIWLYNLVDLPYVLTMIDPIDYKKYAFPTLDMDNNWEKCADLIDKILGDYFKLTYFKSILIEYSIYLISPTYKIAKISKNEHEQRWYDSLYHFPKKISDEYHIFVIVPRNKIKHVNFKITSY